MVAAANSGATDREICEVMAQMVVKKFVEFAVDALVAQIADELGR
jgi:hypothetical protein